MQQTLVTSNQNIKTTRPCTVQKKGLTFFNSVIHPKLTFNQPHDIYEQEADAVADKVMKTSDVISTDNLFFKPAVTSLQRKCAHCEEEEKKELQRKEANTNETIVDTSTENYIRSLNGKGRLLTQNEKNFFEPRFGYDFSNVQLHTNTEANESAKSINALAYTHGNNIVQGPNQYQSNTDAGKKLLAHELTHVVQQNKDVISKKDEPRLKYHGEAEQEECEPYLQSFDKSLKILEESVESPQKPVPVEILKAIQLLRVFRESKRVTCWYTSGGLFYASYHNPSGQIRLHIKVPRTTAGDTILHEAIHALHAANYPEIAAIYGRTLDDKRTINKAQKILLSKWKAWTEYWAYRGTSEYYNNQSESGNHVDEDKKAKEQIKGSLQEVYNLTGQEFDPAQWIPAKNVAHPKKEEKKLRRKESSAQPTEASSETNSYINSLPSKGSPLSNETRNFFGPRFGHDFSDVKIHTDGEAVKSAQSVNALAYTVGNNIVFNQNQFAPNSDSGKKLLAHELTHVVQQTNARHPGVQKQDASKDAGASQPLRFDVLGSDYGVDKSFAQGAALEPGIDLHITSLADLVTQLNGQLRGSNKHCVGEVNFWNHGSPGGQDIAGTETIATKDGLKYKIPNQRLSLSWLLNEHNLSTVEAFRNLFCCNGLMRWLGCGTVGVTAQGGLRSEQNEKKNDGGMRDYDMRYNKYGDRYQSVQDALQHGAQLEGGQFGFLNAQTWANATCLDVIANNDFTYMGPGVTPHHYRPGFGGNFLTFHPAGKDCSCHASSGTIQGHWTVKKGKENLLAETSKLLGPDYLWHVHLRKFNLLQQDQKNHLAELKDVLQDLLNIVQPRLSIPADLPKGSFSPAVGIANTTKWAGVTSENLVFCFPKNFWQWMAFNQNIIKTSPEYTISSIEHELMHASDMWKAATEFQKIQPAPPVNPDPTKCSVDQELETWNNPFGDYVRSFVAFYKKSTSPSRHAEIYARSVKNHIQGMSSQEILNWFSAALTEVQPNMPAATHLELEDVIDPYFDNPTPANELIRDGIVNTLLGTCRNYILDEGKDPASTRERRDKGRTFVTHFKKIWRPRPEVRKLFERALHD